jgi:hypothetical protein
MVLFLVAWRLLIIGMMNIFNLAHAGFFMLAAYFACKLLFGPAISGWPAPGPDRTACRNGHGKISSETDKRLGS